MISRKLYFLVLFVLLVSFAPAGYSFTTHPDAFIKVDFDDANDINIQPTWTSFVLTDSGGEVNDIAGSPSGVIIDIGGSAASARRDAPNNSLGVGIAKEQVYRDFFYGLSDNPLEVTLWGLGAERKCKIYIYAYDNNSTSRRVANWTANGEELFTTDFTGGNPDEWPIDPNDPLYFLFPDAKYYDFNGIAYADDLGSIYLTCTTDSNNEDTPFAFANALVIVTYGDANTVYKAQHPVPLDDAEDVPINTVLQWKAGDYADTHDVYLGTDDLYVAVANRSDPLGVLVSQDHLTESYDPASFLDLGTTYYWRIDEVNDPNIWKGEVWSFTTSSYFVMEDFDSYDGDLELEVAWDTNSTSAEISVESVITIDGNSMKYSYDNNLPPYYSEVCADIADLGVDDPNWLGVGTNALVLYVYGQQTNPVDEQMYVTLTDGDCPAGTATVYDNINYARIEQWNKWSIPLTEFNDVNLANVASITIGFGDGSPGNAGAVYFEDITLDTEVEVFTEVTGEVDVNIIYQQLEGFGGAACYDAPALAYHPSKEEVYDLLFADLGLDALRIKNTYDISSSEIIATGQIVSEAREATRNPDLKLLLVPWSPAAYLKNHPDLGHLNSTLKKDANDPNNSPPYYYVYKAYADWWLDSLIGPGGFNSVGIYPDYISIQNEPDWGQQDQVCRFRYKEDSTYAGYDEAFEAVYNAIDGNVSPMPKMLAPESVGFGSSRAFINRLITTGQIDNVYGFSHHLYGDGSYNNPDGMITEPGYTMQEYADIYGFKPLFQTEYGPSGTPTFAHAVLLAQHIYNSLVYERVISYYHWSLFRNGSYTTGGMINLNVGSGYTIRDLYWFFKHYAYFTDPGWYVVGTSLGGTGTGDLRMVAFKSPNDDELTVVVLNKSANGHSLKLSLNGFAPDSSEVYRSSETENWLYLGTYSSPLLLPAYSITTVHMTGTAIYDCPDVLSSGYGLTSDIYPDCYVNYEDLQIITDYWLNSDCGLYGDCGGADFEPVDGTVDLFDLSKFAEQWLWCNNPEDENCTANW